MYQSHMSVVQSCHPVIAMFGLIPSKIHIDHLQTMLLSNQDDTQKIMGNPAMIPGKQMAFHRPPDFFSRKIRTAKIPRVFPRLGSASTSFNQGTEAFASSKARSNSWTASGRVFLRHPQFSMTVKWDHPKCAYIFYHSVTDVTKKTELRLSVGQNHPGFLRVGPLLFDPLPFQVTQAGREKQPFSMTVFGWYNHQNSHLFNQF